MAVRFFTMPKPLGETLAENANLKNPKLPNGISETKETAQSAMAGAATINSNSSPRQKALNGITFANQDSLPKLPIPDLESTCNKYLECLAPLQSPREHEETKAAVHEFLKTDGPELQDKLKNYATSKSSYIEQFCEFSFTFYMRYFGCYLCGLVLKPITDMFTRV